MAAANIPHVEFQISERTFMKNPRSSDLGMRIISGSIDLIAELGFEAFTFRKLAQAIGSTEASVYRYFESKHKLLLYLSAWYWNWTEHRLMFALANIASAETRLGIAIDVLTSPVKEDGAYSNINEPKLSAIIFDEASKAYLTKDVDAENREGVFLAYKRVVQHVCDIILEINKNYRFPHMLVSTVVEGAHLQRYFAEHLPRLTDHAKGCDAVVDFNKEMVFRAIQADVPK